MSKYCTTHFEIKGHGDYKIILNELGLKAEKIITDNDYFELHFGYVTRSDITWENISDILYQTIKTIESKSIELALLKQKYNLTYDLPIDSNTVDTSNVLILDGPIITFLDYTKTNKDLSWHFF